MASDTPAGERVLPQADFETERLTVVVLSEGPRAGELSTAERQLLANEHLRYTIGLAASGHLIGAGALIDDDPVQRLTGLGFSRLSADELRPAVENDPAVQAGMESVKFLTYVFRKGNIEFRLDSR